MAMTFLTKLKPEPMGKYNSSTAYGVNSLVMSEDGVAAYISVKDVPAGTPLTNTEYWQVHTDLTEHTETAVQKWLNAHPEVTTTVQDGSINFDKLNACLKEKIDTIAEPTEINLISIYGELNNGNISAAITEALNRSSRLYIPAGSYAFNVAITKNCVIRLDDECTISTNNNSPAIKVQNCSFSLIGGNVCAGNADISMDEAKRKYVGWDDNVASTQSEHNGIIFIENCKNVTINSVKVPYSKFASTFLVVDSENVEFSNIDAKNILSSCIMVQNRAKNVYVRNCSFRNIYPKKGVTYCYAFATGLISLTDTGITPPDNIIVENCYVENSEDCAIDTHGATNVLFQNNEIIDCRTAITAYNDNNRVKRPAGWVMKNVTIRNNYCKSEKVVLDGELKHPFVFLGASNAQKVNGAGYPGGYDTYQNLVLENNVFISKNKGYDTSLSTVYTNQAIRHARICNNYLDGCNTVPRGFYFLGTFDCVVENNVLENYASSSKIFFRHAKCVVKNNRTSVGNGIYNWSTSENKAVYYKNESYNGLFTFASPCMAMGDLRMTDDGSQVFINTKRGITARSNYSIQTITGTATDGIVEITSGFLPIEGMGMTLGSDQYYVSKMIDTTHMKVLKKNGDAIPNSDVEITFIIERSVEKQI